MAPAENYLLHISLRNTDSPTITRTLSVPPSATFFALHQGIQVAFSWAQAHLFIFRFDVRNPPSKFDEAGNYHRTFPLLEIDDGDAEDFGRMPGEPESVDGHTITLKKVFEDMKLSGETNTIEYEYDFGDCWEHDIHIVGRAPRTTRIVCTEGTGHPAAEDGGVGGWESLKKSYQRSEKSLSHVERSRMEWYEENCLNGDEEGLGGTKVYEWNIAEANEMLRGVRLKA